MTDLDLAWLAGIIDGEGSIFIMRQRRKDRDRDINYLLRISVDSTDPYMAIECHNIAGGPIIHQQRDNRPECSDRLKWQINGKRALRLLEELLPFLRVKKDQASIAIEFQRTTKKHWKKMTDLEYHKQAEFYLALKQAKTNLKLGKRPRAIYGSAGV